MFFLENSTNYGAHKWFTKGWETFDTVQENMYLSLGKNLNLKDFSETPSTFFMDVSNHCVTTLDHCVHPSSLLNSQSGK